MDIGSFRDLSRHRKVNKILQDISVEAGLLNEFTEQMNEHFRALNEYKKKDPLYWSYVLPMATVCSSLHQMDLSEAACIIELRTGTAGHFSYREIAYQMFESLAVRYPHFAEYIRAINPREVFDPFQR